MAEKNSGSLYYPLTKMNFLVTVDSVNGIAAFSEVTGVEATVDVIEFRQGNSNSLAPVKIPGLVKHGNVTLKFGYTRNNAFKDWLKECVTERRSKDARANVTIELINIQESSPQQVVESTIDNTLTWQLTNAWVCKYTAPDLNASTSEVAIESVELAYEELVIPN
ncbi:MAG: phage tail protein [Hydrogeniiclostridium sp.]|jgi:phage tail-like protein